MATQLAGPARQYHGVFDGDRGALWPHLGHWRTPPVGCVRDGASGGCQGQKGIGKLDGPLPLPSPSRSLAPPPPSHTKAAIKAGYGRGLNSSSGGSLPKATSEQVRLTVPAYYKCRPHRLLSNIVLHFSLFISKQNKINFNPIQRTVDETGRDRVHWHPLRGL